MFYLLNDQLNFNASLNLFSNIGENIGKLSEEIKSLYSAIDWKKIRGFRNRVVHDYINIDTFMVFDIIHDEMDKLKLNIEDIISKELKTGNFDKDEFCEATNSFYYRHINFSNIKLRSN